MLCFETCMCQGYIILRSRKEFPCFAYVWFLLTKSHGALEILLNTLSSSFAGEVLLRVLLRKPIAK